LSAFQARKIAYALKVAEGSPDAKKTNRQFVDILSKLATLFEKEDCSLCEVNPLVITKSGDVVALDAKINFDDNAAGRHPEWAELLDEGEEDPVELEAKQAGLSYVSLNGNIGCLVNGAGLAMATMDIIQHHGGTPANFLDVGGGATKDQVKKAFSMILSSPQVKGIFVNIFGGIAKCDMIAEGIVAATKELGLSVPLVVRLEGTNVELGKQILASSGLAIQPADGMADGAKKIVAAVKG
jgi:succinyl-CoA synthetase beta subunit